MKISISLITAASIFTVSIANAFPPREDDTTINNKKYKLECEISFNINSMLKNFSKFGENISPQNAQNISDQQNRPLETPNSPQHSEVLQTQQPNSIHNTVDSNRMNYLVKNFKKFGKNRVLPLENAGNISNQQNRPLETPNFPQHSEESQPKQQKNKRMFVHTLLCDDETIKRIWNECGMCNVSPDMFSKGTQGRLSLKAVNGNSNFKLFFKEIAREENYELICKNLDITTSWINNDGTLNQNAKKRLCTAHKTLYYEYKARNM